MADDLIRDPKMLRALAHPFRWKLINLLLAEGPRTATQCSAALGESVASCSYHLKMLAKYGFVGEVPDVKGRQKPWRLLRKSQTWSSADLDDEGASAAEAASDAFLEQEFAAVRAQSRRNPLEAEDWRDALGVRGRMEFLTVREVEQITAEVMAVIERYSDRHDHPEERPEGARPVRFFLATTASPRRD
ncbi:ArsR/SmtB family transcription factor [Actinosynnema sp. CS-041913]|uniref:ArsR/SmtB family transcription factor n=1 Tax=Actinosynnema sp. CS-041913 TaxID=3239917 RepID=UPI003D91C0AF